MRGFIGAAMAAMAASLLGAIVVERHQAATEAARQALAAPAPTQPQANRAAPVADPLPAAEAVIAARPLFEADRRPPTAAVAADSGPQGLPRLTGVLVTPAGRSVIFAPASGGKPVIAMEGTRIGAFQIQSIGNDEVTVLGPSGVRTVRLSFQGGRAVDAGEATAPPVVTLQAPAAQPAVTAPPPMALPLMPPGFNPSANPNTIILPLSSPS